MRWQNTHEHTEALTFSSVHYMDVRKRINTVETDTRCWLTLCNAFERCHWGICIYIYTYGTNGWNILCTGEATSVGVSVFVSMQPPKYSQCARASSKRMAGKMNENIYNIKVLSYCEESKSYVLCSSVCVCVSARRVWVNALHTVHLYTLYSVVIYLVSRDCLYGAHRIASRAHTHTLRSYTPEWSARVKNCEQHTWV